MKKKAMANKFTRVIDQVTDSTLVETNWEGIIYCTDMIRSGEFKARPALDAIRKRLKHENPHVVMHTLFLLDACVKNCGSKIHIEISTRDFMEDFKNLVTENKYDEVKNKALEMLQCWATAFANRSEYKMIVDTHNLLKMMGFDFPSLKEADAMFLAQVAPEWQDGSECYRCRSTFSLLNRKHHCRACGQIFCDKCSSKEMALPQFGIEKEVRVCETCFDTECDKKVKEFKAKKTPLSDKLKKEKEDQERALQEKEEEELALALAISQSEAEAAKKEEQRALYSYYNGSSLANSSSDAPSNNGLVGYKGAADDAPPASETSAPEDPLARYLNRDYWQQKKEGKTTEEWNTTMYGATAPPPSEPSVAPSICSTMMAVDDSSLNSDLAAMNLGTAVPPTANTTITDDVKVQAEDTMKWCQSIKEQVSVMDNRIRSNLARGRPVFNDSAIQDLFSKLTELHSHVLSRMHTLDEQRAYYESLQDHLANIGEARQAINELRDEHERKRQERLAEEQRQRQAQMQQTLEMMRMKKHAMLMEQREQALQRFQQQQQEMAMRRQQQQYYNYPNQQPQAQQYYGYQQQQQQQQQPGQNYYPQNQYYQQPQQAATHMQNPVTSPQYQAPQQPSVYPQQQQQQHPQQYYQQYQQYQQGYGEVGQDNGTSYHQAYAQPQLNQQQSHHPQAPHQNVLAETSNQQTQQNVAEQPLISFD